MLVHEQLGLELGFPDDMFDALMGVLRGHIGKLESGDLQSGIAVWHLSLLDDRLRDYVHAHLGVTSSDLNQLRYLRDHLFKERNPYDFSSYGYLTGREGGNWHFLTLSGFDKAKRDALGFRGIDLIELLV
ncbi:MAG: hypothetical protein AAGM67_08660, partial [Bacteroidota bacterium]